MRRTPCQSFLASIFAFLIFLQSFVGVAIVIYSVYVLQRWRKGGNEVDFSLHHFPTPWYFWATMSAGALMCLVSFVGWIAAETISGCCLCFYSILIAIVILLEESLASFVVIDKHWEEDLPNDPSGELIRFSAFVKADRDVAILVGAAVLSIQALSFLMALILRANRPRRQMYYGSDEDSDRIRQPLLEPQIASASIDNRGFNSRYWNSQLRQKYGLNQNEHASRPIYPTAPLK